MHEVSAHESRTSIEEINGSHLREATSLRRTAMLVNQAGVACKSCIVDRMLTSTGWSQKQISGEAEESVVSSYETESINDTG